MTDSLVLELEPERDRHASLPGRFYTEPAIFELEKERIFARAWQYAGHISRLSAPGRYITLSFLDEQLVFVRGANGEIEGFHNVCRHRAHRLLEGSGCVSSIVCPYHAWRYGLDGRLEHARNAENVKGFERSEFSLRPVKVERFLDFLMFNLDLDAPGFATQVPGLAEEIRTWAPWLGELVLEERAKGLAGDTLCCNWKVLVDNCVECLHCQPSHPAFTDLVDMDSYRIELHPMHTTHIAKCRKPRNRAYHYRHPAAVDAVAFWHVWPNLTFGFFPGTVNFGVFSIDPLGVSLTGARGDSLRADGPQKAEEVERRRYIDEVLWPEDRDICEAVQRGVGSRAYTPHRLSVSPPYDARSEVVCHLMQRLNLAALGVGSTGDGEQ